jgi:hypothetical protein
LYFAPDFHPARTKERQLTVGTRAGLIDRETLLTVDGVNQAVIQTALNGNNIPPVPSGEEMKRHFSVPPSKSFFFSIGCRTDDCLDIVDERARAEGLQTIRMSWYDPAYPYTWDDGGAIAAQFFNTVSLAFSEVSSGIIYVLLPKDQTFPPNSTWTTIEWPALMRNKKVEKIIKLNPVNTIREVLYPR